MVKLDTYEHCTYSSSKSKEILGFHWVESIYCDLVVITRTGIDFLRLSERTLKLTSVKHNSISIGHYWYEPIEGIFVTACSPPKLGGMHTFFMNQNKGPKYFQGPRFSVDLTPSVTDNWTTSHPNISNLTRLDHSQKIGDPHRVVLTRLYDASYFIHLNCVKGVVNFYTLSYEKVDYLSLSIILEPGPYELRVVDNVIIVENFSVQESYLYDIKSQKYSASPFCTVWHGFSREPPNIECEIQITVDTESDEDYSILPKLKLNSKDLNSNHRVLPYTKSVHRVDVAHTLDTSFCNFDNDLCINIGNSMCYKLELEPEVLVKDHPDRMEAILFLLRRTGCKHKSFAYLKQCLESGLELAKVSTLFATVNMIYKIAALERKSSKRDSIKKYSVNYGNTSDSRRSYSGTRPVSTELELKIETGMTVLLQSDMFTLVFKPLFDEHKIDYNYLTAVLLEYQRSLIDQDIQVHQNLQLLLARLLIKTHNYNTLHQLIQYHIFTDSRDFANILLALSNPNNLAYYSPAFQLSMDMFSRLKANDEIADALMDKSMVYDALCHMMSHSCTAFDIKKLLEVTEKQADSELTYLVNQFIKDQSL